MSEICSCGTGGMGNTGLPDCYKPFTVWKGIFMVQTYDSTGVKNAIPTTEDVDDAYILERISDPDLSKRWYPLQEILGIESARGENVYEEFPNGSRAFVKNGVRPFGFFVLQGGPSLIKAINKGRCSEFSMFALESGKIVGMNLTGGDKLYPIRMAASSLTANLILATDSSVEKVQINFDWDSREIDDNLSYMTVASDVELLSYRGLLDIHATYSAITTTGFKANLYTNSVALNGKGAMKNLVAGDFTLYNVTDSSNVTITSATEGPDGTYTFVFAAQTSGDKLRLTATKVGYDFANVVENLVTIP